MPLVDPNDPALWDGGPSSLYRCEIEGQVHGFSRVAGFQYYGSDLDRLIDALETHGLVRGQRIAIIGCGFAWSSERLDVLGFGPPADNTTAGRVVSTDTSTWIHNNKTGNAQHVIMNADVNTEAGRQALHTALAGQEIDWAISEDVMPILSDPEAQTLSVSMRLLAQNVAHWITVGTRKFDDQNVWTGDARLNWKTIADWKALMMPDLVVRRGTSEVL